MITQGGGGGGGRTRDEPSASRREEESKDYLREVFAPDDAPVHLHELDRLCKVSAAAVDDGGDALREVLELVHASGGEVLRVGLARKVEVPRDLGVHPDRERVVEALYLHPAHRLFLLLQLKIVVLADSFLLHGLIDILILLRSCTRCRLEDGMEYTLGGLGYRELTFIVVSVLAVVLNEFLPFRSWVW